MTRTIAAVTVIAMLGAFIPPADAGPCSAAIAQFETAVRQSAAKPDAGPFLRQSVGAQLGREPTPASIARAQKRAQAAFDRALLRAKRLDAHGDSRCTAALAAAEGMYDLH